MLWALLNAAAVGRMWAPRIAAETTALPLKESAAARPRGRGLHRHQPSPSPIDLASAFAWKHALDPTPPALRSPPGPALSLARERFAEKRASGSRPRRVARRSRSRPNALARDAKLTDSAGSCSDESGGVSATRGRLSPASAFHV